MIKRVNKFVVLGVPGLSQKKGEPGAPGTQLKGLDSDVPHPKMGMAKIYRPISQTTQKPGD